MENKINIAFEIPDNILNMLKNGAAVRHGGSIRQVDGKIVCLLRETDAFSNTIIDFSNSFTSKDFNSSQIINNFSESFKELMPVLNSMKLLSFINLSSSIINLGVSSASFYFINKKLNLISNQLYSIQNNLSNIENKVDLIKVGNEQLADFLRNNSLAELRTALEELCEIKFYKKFSQKQEQIIYVKRKFKECNNKFELYLKSIDTKQLDSKNYNIYDKFLKGFGLSIIGELQCALSLNNLDLANDIIDKNLYKLKEITAHFSKEEIINYKIRIIEEQIGPHIIINKNKLDNIKNNITYFVTELFEIHNEIYNRIDSYKYEIEEIKGNNFSYDEWCSLGNKYNNENKIIFLLK